MAGAESRNPFTITGRWMRDSRWFNLALRYTGTVAIGVSGLLGTLEPSWEDWAGEVLTGFIIGTALAGASLIVDITQQSEQRALATKVVQLTAKRARLSGDVDALQQVVADARTIAVDVIKNASERHGLGPDERVTVYRRDGDQLAVVYRWSQDSDFAAISPPTLANRFDYEFGLIGKVARRNRRMMTADGPPTTDTKQYNAWQRDCGLKANEVRELRMKSRCYDVVPLADHRNDVVGVVAVESTSPRSDAVTSLASEIDAMTGTGIALRGLIAVQSPTNESDQQGGAPE